MDGCIIHKGAVRPDNFMPVDENGDYILYGYRTCGLKECVNPAHLTKQLREARTLDGSKPEVLFNRRPDITGEELHKIAAPLFRGTAPRTCKVPKCINKHKTMNLCGRHASLYFDWKRANGLGRTRQDFSKGLPEVLQERIPYEKMTMSQRRCHAEDCDRAYYGRGLCALHYKRYRRLNGATW